MLYDLAGHAAMISDVVRVEAYARAIAAVVRPDDVVLDAGCGVGIFAVLAAKAGARRVYAVDEGDCALWARRLAEWNDVADRVEVFRGPLADVVLPEPATVVVGDVRGALPLDVGGAGAWEAARTHLAAGGRTIPQRDVVHAQPIRSDTLFERVHGCGPVAGARLDPLRPAFAQYRHELPDDAEFLGEPRPLFDVRYDAPTPPRYLADASFVADRPWTVDAFVLGFVAELAPGISYASFGPGRARVYGLLVAPTPGRITVPPGVTLGLKVACEVADDMAPLSWAVSVGDREEPWQGPLAESAWSLDVVRAGLAGHVPGPDVADDLDAFVLGSFGQARSVGETVSAACERFATRVSVERIQGRVAELARKRQARVVRRIGPS